MVTRKKKAETLHERAATYSPRLGSNIRFLRRRAKVTQEDFASMLGVHQSALSRIESGEQGLTPAQLIIAADYFGMTLDDLVFMEDNEKK